MVYHLNQDDSKNVLPARETALTYKRSGSCPNVNSTEGLRSYYNICTKTITSNG